MLAVVALSYEEEAEITMEVRTSYSFILRYYYWACTERLESTSLLKASRAQTSRLASGVALSIERRVRRN